MSVSSFGSSKCSASSMRLAVAARKAALLVEAEHQKQMKILEMEELRLIQQRSDLELKQKIAMAIAEEQALSENGIIQESMPDFSDLTPTTSEKTIGWAARLPINEQQVRQRNSTILKNKESQLKTDQESFASQFTGQSIRELDQVVDREPACDSAAIKDPIVDILQCIRNGQEQQQQLIKAIYLPKTELPVFAGDPATYWHFVRAFEHSIDRCNIDDTAKLTRLLQYCTGKAKKTIESCVAMSASIGYTRAKQLLHERFGDDYLIAEAWVSKVMNRPNLKLSDREALLDLADDVKSCKEILQAIGMVGEIDSQRSMVRLAGKLPLYLQNRWKYHVYKIRASDGRLPNIEDFSTFIDAAAKEANDPVYGNLACDMTTTVKKATVATEGRQVPIKSDGFATQAKGLGVRKCGLCSGDHTLSSCESFKLKSPEQRYMFIQDHKLCRNCFIKGHFAWKCAAEPCSVDGCGQLHNALLHPETPPNSYADEKSQKENTTVKTVVQSVNVNQSSVMAIDSAVSKIALPIVPVRVRSVDGRRWVTTYALLDSCSTSSFCSMDVVQQLAVQGQDVKLELTNLQGIKADVKTIAVQLVIGDVEGQHEVMLPVVYTRDNLHLNGNNLARLDEVESYAHLKDIVMPNIKITDVNLLIGQNAPELLQPHEIRHGRQGELYATRTLLGWTINGPFHTSERHVAHVNYAHVDDLFNSQVEQFWRVDGYDMTAAEEQHMSREDEDTIKVWEETVMHKADQHYEMKIPFKSTNVVLPDNKLQALGRLKMLGKKLIKDEHLKKLYTAGIHDMLRMGYAEKIDETQGVNGKRWYVPHHGVCHPSKPGKVRIVFDCSAKYKEACLNSSLFPGPDLTNKLVGVLQRFRQEEVAITADIEAMYHQIGVMQADRDVLRFLWWRDDDVTKDAECYRMTVQPFGGVWSPSCACFVLRKTAVEGFDFPEEVRQTVIRNFYVDDCLKSTATEEEAISMIHQLRQLLSRGGFKLHKWLSNSRAVLATVQDDDRSACVKGLDLGNDLMPNGRVLGVKWFVDTDELGFDVKISTEACTRRGILSFVSTIYDPLGLVSPAIVMAKHIIQELTRKRLGWDEEIGEPELSTWNAWVAELGKIVNFRIPRCLKSPGFGVVINIQLHHFGDASEVAYGVVSYVRYVNVEGQVHTSLLCSKSRLAPLKAMKIPRLELSAAALAVQVDLAVRRDMEFKVTESHFWTDSLVVLR